MDTINRITVRVVKDGKDVRTEIFELHSQCFMLGGWCVIDGVAKFDFHCETRLASNTAPD